MVHIYNDHISFWYKAYYKYVADTTRQDKEQYKDTDVFTESIRLTDEEQVKQQTDEDGDIFHWLKHQAQKGVFSAQVRIIPLGNVRRRKHVSYTTRKTEITGPERCILR